MQVQQSKYSFGADSVDVDKVTEDQLATLKLAFDALESKENAVTSKNVDALFRSVGLNVPDSELVKIQKTIDMGNGTIDFSTLLTVLGEQITVNSPDEREILESFKVFDTSGSGVIDTQELKNYFLSLGDFKEAEVDEMLSTADVDGTGKIRYYQLVKSLLLR